MIVGGLALVWLVFEWWRYPIFAMRFYASEIQDSSDGKQALEDLARCIRAKCTEESFQRFAQQQGFTQIVTAADLKRDDRTPFWSSCSKPWWTPPPSIVGAYIKANGPPLKHGWHHLRLLGYEAGYLYYESRDWGN